jgi:hypothetical protein
MPIGGTPESGSQGRRRERAAAALSGRGGSRFLLARRLAAAGQNRGATAILDGRQSPRRHAMAMLISLSHRDEREITVLPPNPIWAFGVNRKTPLLCAPPVVPDRGKSQSRSGAPWLRQSWRGPTQNGPLAGDSQSARGPVHRTGSGRRRRRRRECRRPNARNFAPAGAQPARARGTECDNLDGAAPHTLACDVGYPADHEHHRCWQRRR